MNVTIEKLIYGGDGLAHHNGATVFVPFVLPGEVAEITEVERKKKYVRGRVREWVTTSPERTAAACPHFGICGGCHYQHIPYPAQLRFKSEILRETLRRLGRIDWTGAIREHASPPWGYRNRAQWKVRPRGPAKHSGATTEKTAGSTAANGALGIGYFRAGSTALCAVEECPVLSPRLVETLGRFRAALAKGELPVALREVTAFADASDTKVLVNASFAGFSSSPTGLIETIRAAVPGIESLLLNDLSRERMELDGPGYLKYEAGAFGYRVGHFSFFQVNRFLVDELVGTVLGDPGEAASGRQRKLALDLFCGVGLFTRRLAERYERVVAVEANPAAVRDLDSNVAGTGGVETREADVEAFLHEWKDTPDLVVLDPPRAGMTPETVARLAEIAPAEIAYVSCEPSTLARDLALLTTKGFLISEVHLFDHFPETFHIESFVRLTRRP
ncbi:MAG: 23S rRNA (uracil(1939)-C(5))-methyltransferase RlmD [Candidatus Acidiferrales bacterium]